MVVDVVVGTGVRRTARALSLHSDSSYRFERGVDFEQTRRALDRATALVLEICGGRAGPVSEACATLPAREPVNVRLARAEGLLGITFEAVGPPSAPRISVNPDVLGSASNSG